VLHGVRGLYRASHAVGTREFAAPVRATDVPGSSVDSFLVPRPHEQVLELFGRLHRDDEYEGTGMGLSLVKKGGRGARRIDRPSRSE
jgi:hypothetical protein